MRILKRSFYARKTDLVAKELLGKVIIRELPDTRVIAMIVETEAYFGLDDPASHASRGITNRSKIMYGEPGHAYVYLNYGVHWLLNFVTETHGYPGAVLIRGLEPLEGVDEMFGRRKVKAKKDLTNGPGKLTKALAVDKTLNGHDLSLPPLQVADLGFKIDAENVVCATRIGISVAKDKLLRYYIRGNHYVSKH